MTTYDRKRERREEREREWEKERAAREYRANLQFVGTNRADGLQFLTCVKCGAMVDPEYSNAHLDACGAGR